MKIYLDDLRRAPVGWTRVKTAEACIARLKTGRVEELSLDHDLAEEHYVEGSGYMSSPAYKEKTGMAVVEWMIANKVWPSSIVLHTMNPIGRENMRLAIERHAPHVKLEIRIGWRG